MDSIKAVLGEELENSQRLLRKYKTELRKLPKGSLVAKEIKGNIYYYLASRDGARVEFKYLGKLSKKEVKKYKEAKSLKAKYRKLMAELKKQISFLERALHERKRRAI